MYQTSYIRRDEIVGTSGDLDQLCQGAQPIGGRILRLEILVELGLKAGDTPPTERMPEFQFFFDGPEGALVVLIALVLTAIKGAPVPSRSAIAKRFGLSKTQVTRVLTAGAAQGFFTLDSDGAAALTRAAREGYDRWVALELAFYAAHMQPSGGERD